MTRRKKAPRNGTRGSHSEGLKCLNVKKPPGMEPEGPIPRGCRIGRCAQGEGEQGHLKPEEKIDGIVAKSLERRENKIEIV